MEEFENTKVQNQMMYALPAFFALSVIFYLVIKYQVPLEELLASSILAACFLPLVIFSTLLLICVGKMKDKYCCIRQNRQPPPELDTITTIGDRPQFRNTLFPDLPTYQQAIASPKAMDQGVQTEMFPPPPYNNSGQIDIKDLSNTPPPEYMNHGNLFEDPAPSNSRS